MPQSAARPTTGSERSFSKGRGRDTRTDLPLPPGAYAWMDASPRRLIRFVRCRDGPAPPRCGMVFFRLSSLELGLLLFGVLLGATFLGALLGRRARRRDETL